MWDELAAAAWIDPTLITKRVTRYMGIDLARGAGYGNTLTWAAKMRRGCPRVPSKCRWTWTMSASTGCSCADVGTDGFLSLDISVDRARYFSGEGVFGPLRLMTNCWISRRWRSSCSAAFLERSL